MPKISPLPRKRKPTNAPSAVLAGKPLMPLYAGVADMPETSSARPEYRKLPPNVTTMGCTPQ